MCAWESDAQTDSRVDVRKGQASDWWGMLKCKSGRADAKKKKKKKRK